MYVHKTVLLDEAVDMLNIKPDGIYVDATTGGGGHSSLILSKLTTGHLYCFDQDDYAFERSKERLDKIGSNYTFVKSNFVDIKKKLNELGIERIDGIIYDLGVSSFQFDIPERGFSYNYDAPLDMRMNQDAPLSAYNIVNEWSYEEIVRVLFRYGEDPFSKQIARAIFLTNKKPSPQHT
jgi:16S rRNA (cytosine1402-N4)-methyltransferase